MRDMKGFAFNEGCKVARAVLWGKTHNEEARKIISEANKQKVSCPHCGKTGGIAIMKRWHFGNCKVLT